MKKNRFKKIIASFLAIVLTLGIVVPTTIEIAEAAKMQVRYHGSIDLPGASSVVGKFTIDGEQAFCMQHTKLRPSDNSYGDVAPYDDNRVKKALNYGWAGHEQWSGFKAKDKYNWTQKEHGIVLTSLLLSCYYNGDSPSSYSYIDGFDDFKKFVEGKPNIEDNRAAFSVEKLTAKWDSDLGLQKTGVFKILGTKGHYIKFTLPDGVTLVNYETGAKDVGAVKAKVGQKYYLTAEATVTKTFKTGKIGRNWKYQPMRFKAFASGPQDVGYAKEYVDPAMKTSLTVKWSALGKAQITKVSESGKAIKGAKFNIKKKDGSYEKNVTTNENGVVLVDSLVAGDYTVTETYVPKPYLLDKTPKTVTVKPNDIAAVAFTNNLPTGKIIIVKSDSYNNLLKGAVYRITSVGNDPEGVPINYSKDFTTDGNGNITRFLFLSAFNLTFFICQHQY